MTIYATFNPIGSTHPKDLIDNAQNLDYLILGPALLYPDRRAVNRLSWAGIESAFATAQAARAAEYAADKAERDSEFAADQAQRESDFQAQMASMGWELPALTYAAGLNIARVTQLIERSGEYYAAKPGMIPFTTTGTWAMDLVKLKSVGDAALRSELASDYGGTLVGMPVNIPALMALPAPSLAAGRTVIVNTDGQVTAADGGGGPWRWQYNSNETHDGYMVVKPNSLSSGQPGRWKRVQTDFIRPEYFGAIGDFNWTTQTGTVNTTALQTMFNWCSKTGAEIRPLPGKKYLTDTLRLYYHATLNPGWTGNAGRTKIVGQANGHATGATEDPGDGFVHINGSAAPLLDCTGLWSLENPVGSAGFLTTQDIAFIGGNATTHVMNISGASGQINRTNTRVMVRNPAGNGITEATTWGAYALNDMIWGAANGDGSWTGIGLNITGDGSGGQINMKTYIQSEIYKLGYGIRVGRRALAQGTFGPLAFIAGQTAWSDQVGMWLDGGVIDFTAISHQTEQTRLNGLRIDSAGANDIPRSIKMISCYFTHCGKIADGSNDEFAIHVVDGVGVELDNIVFNEARSGIVFDRSKALDLKIRRLTTRTVNAYGAASGRGIEAYGTLTAGVRITCEDPVFVNGFATNITTLAQEQFDRSNAGEVLSLGGSSTTPSISLAGRTANQPAKQVNFNYSSAVTLSNILGGRQYMTVLFTFSNTNVTIPNDHTHFYLNGSAFTPSNSKSSITMRFDGTFWCEVSRAQNA